MKIEFTTEKVPPINLFNAYLLHPVVSKEVVVKNKRVYRSEVDSLLRKMYQDRSNA